MSDLISDWVREATFTLFFFPQSAKIKSFRVYMRDRRIHDSNNVNKLKQIKLVNEACSSRSNRQVWFESFFSGKLRVWFQWIHYVVTRLKFCWSKCWLHLKTKKVIEIRHFILLTTNTARNGAHEINPIIAIQKAEQRYIKRAFGQCNQFRTVSARGIALI